MANDTETWDRGELVTTIGPLSIFRSASAFTPEGATDGEIQMEHRYTVRVDPSWVTTGGVVAFELEPPYFAVATGNRLDTVDSIVEFTRNPETENAQINVLVIAPASTVEQASSDIALTIRCE
ncbi:MAG: hypothetical protein ABSG16_21000 [Candidatus Acidiferrum sp.]|jgi:hypothetical protein